MTASAALRRSRAPRILTALLAVATAVAVAPAPAEAALPPWHGGVSTWKPNVFTTQATWQWCTAANVQIMRNMVYGLADHSRSNQQRYYEYMRTKNKYRLPASDGVDPQGWSAGLRAWVDLRYRAISHTSFDAALRAAVRSLRLTSRPVALLVARGGHGWVLNGFTATADPAVTTSFTITSVNVTGPLWGRQSRTWGYDMTPNKRLTPLQLRQFWTPWHYAPIRMMWEGRIVQVQAVPG
jgi:hypothetical protein